MVPSVLTMRTLFVSISTLLLLSAILPVPVRSQSSSGSGAQVQFPTSSAACTSCKPAFSSASCQTILGSISQPSASSVSNATLAECQCSGSFLSLYSVCVQCFTETNQLDLVFGSSQVPSLTSLSQYCSLMSLPPSLYATTVTKTSTSSSTTATTSPTSSPKIPSSAKALTTFPEGQNFGVKAIYTAIILAMLAC